MSGPPNPCALPGVQVLTDPAGDATPPLAVTDVRSLSVAETFDPANPNVNKLTFTLKMEGGGVLPPNAQWYIIWKRLNPIPADVTGTSGADRNYVAMKTNPTGSPLAPIFKYGTISPPSVNAPRDIGDADSGSYDPATGTITITIANSKIENIGPGQTLSNLEVRIFNRNDASGLLPVTQAAAQEFTAFGQQYQLNGNFFCRPQSAPTAALNATPTSGQVPLTVSFDASASNDLDSGDTIGEYEINFGDGSPVIEQTTPSFSHTYNAVGTYRATLTVRDSRGMPSNNVAAVQITVTAANSPPVAVLTATPTSGNAPLAVSFNGSGSSDPDSGDSITTYSFDFGDGSPPVIQAGATIAHTYSAPGSYTASLIVTDSRGAQSSNGAAVTIQVSEAPSCVEDNDSRIAYSGGWHLINNANASDGHFRYHTGNSSQHFARLDFDVPAGSSGSITYSFAKSSKGGAADVYLDGVFRQRINYNGSVGTTQQPEFRPEYNVSFSNLPAGAHTLEIRNMSGVVYLDRICLQNSNSTAQPLTGPGDTSNQSGNAAAGQTSSSNYQPQSGSQEISVSAESNLNVPFKVVLVDPSGVTLQTADSVSGIATISQPVTQGGIYVIKVVNLSLGPLQFMVTTTPTVRR
jgi:PKD repeat protein